MRPRPSTGLPPLFAVAALVAAALVPSAAAQDHVVRLYDATDGIGAAADLALDADGRVLVATPSGAVRMLGARVAPLSVPGSGPIDLLAIGPRGDAWAARGRHLVSLRGGWSVPLPDSVVQVREEGWWFVRLRLAPDGRVWVNARRGLLYALDPATRRWTVHRVSTDRYTVVGFFFRADTLVVAERRGDDGRVRHLARTATGWRSAASTPAPHVQEVHPRGSSGLWIVTRDAVLLGRAGGAPRRVTPDGLEAWWHCESTTDAAGRLLVGFGDGVRQYDARGRQTAFVRRAEFSGALALRPLMDGEGGLWIAHTQGLAYVEQDHLRVYPVRTSAAVVVKDLVVSPAGTLWAAAWDGLYRVGEADVQRVSPVLPQGGAPATPPVWTPEGTAYWDEGERRYAWSGGRVRTRPADRDVPLATTAAGALVVNRGGTWWVPVLGPRRRLSSDASLERPVSVRDGVVWFHNAGRYDVLVDGWSGQASPERLAPSLRRTLEALAEAGPGELHHDSAGRLWSNAFGVGKGLWCIYRTPDGTWAWRRWEGAKDGFAADISSVYPGAGGRLWIGTWQGLQAAEVHPDSRGRPHLALGRRFGGRDGLGGEQVEAVVEDGEERVWFASAAGCVYRLDPRRVPRLASPAVLFTDLAIADRPVLPGATPIRVRFRNARLSLDLAPRTYRQLHDVRFAYRIVPYDTAWAPLGESHSLRIPVLPVGSQVLEVRATRAGAPPGATARQAFVVSPPYYRQWWFAFAVALLLVAPLAAWYRLRLLRQLAAERLRLRIATDLHDDLGGGLTQVSLYGELLRRQVSGPAEAWAGEIVETARALTETMRDIVWSLSPAEETFGALAARMRAAAAGLCEPTGLALAYTAAGDDDAPMPSGLRRNVLLMFKETVHNAVKHAGAQHLTVTLRADRAALHLTVADDGRGFDPQAPPPGHGLPNLTRRAAELGATLRIESAPERGTCLTLDVPLGRD